MTSLRATTTGVVQGVGYRWFVRDAALAVGIGGWVRNRTDGSVTAELHGEADAVEQVLAAMRRGPAHARVDAVDTTPVPYVAHAAFHILPTE